jgi:hypothetical protein
MTVTLSDGDKLLLSLGLHESQRLRVQRTIKARGDVPPVIQQEPAPTLATEGEE